MSPADAFRQIHRKFDGRADTLIGWQLPAWRKRAKVKEVAHPKFYLFDCGVQRALAGLHRDKPSRGERGVLFETWLLLMMIPYVRDRKRVVRVNLSFDKGFVDTLDEAARMRGMTRSAFVEKAATREILDPV